MTAWPLGEPPLVLSSARLSLKTIDPARLLRISAYCTGEPYFGKSGANRFDSPGCAHGSPEFATCYFGFGLRVAIAETILHDVEPIGGEFRMSPDFLRSKHVLNFAGAKLRLANLTGVQLKKYDGHAGLAGTCDYSLTQRWSFAVYSNPSMVDGFIYMSRHLNTGKAVVLFDRAQSKLKLVAASRLTETVGFASAAKLFGIVGI